jgi:hypothetical protein
MGRIAAEIRRMLSVGRPTGREIVAKIEAMESRAEERVATTAKLKPLFDEFYDEYPHKVGKPAAQKAYTSAVKRGGKPEEILVGLRRYKLSKPADRPWLNPSTFLNQERWNDQPATVVSGNVGDFFGQLADHFGGHDEDLLKAGRGGAQQAPSLALRGPDVHRKG